MIKNVKSDLISDLSTYKSEFEDNYVEEYQLGQCRNYVATDHGGKEMISGLCEQ